MSWTRYLFVFLLLCSLTGTCFSIVWFLLRGRMERYDSRLIYRCLKIIMLFYMLPVTFVGMVLYYEGNVSRTLFAYSYKLFDTTPAILVFMQTILLVWCAGVFISMALQIRDVWKWYRIKRGNIPEDDANAREIFDAICKKLEIGKRVRLVRNDLLPVPVISGLFCPTVMIPCVRYTAEELEVIFTHELVHYKQKDLWIKAAAVVITTLHWMNPIVHLLLYWINIWSEFSCDVNACEVLDATYSARDYYEMIAKRMIHDQKNEYYLMSAMAEKRSEIIRRMEQMRAYKNRKGMSRKKSVAFMTTFMIASLVISFIVGGVTAEAHQRVYNHSVKENGAENSQENNNQKELSKSAKEAIAILDTASTGVLQQDVMEIGANVVEIPLEWNPKVKNAQYNFHWYINCDTYLKTNGFKLNAGDQVVVALTSEPRNLFVKFGLVYPDATMWFTGDYGSISYTFDIEETGEYQIYMHNKNKEQFLEVTGTFFLVTDNYTEEDGGDIPQQ